MTDCLIIGFNDSDFSSYLEIVRSMGIGSGAYRDLNLAFVEYNKRPYRSMDILNLFYFEEKQRPHAYFHNADFLWPVVSYLGSYLHRHGFTFDYTNLFHLQKEQLKQKLLEDDILTIAITTTLYVSPHPILEIVEFIRQYNERAKIIVGGPYISNLVKMYDRVGLQRQLKYLGADIYVISSEGESALINILRALKNGGGLQQVDNLAFRDGEGYSLTNSSTESNPLEENMINYRLFNQDDINEFLSLRTAKSCPFSCSFCGFPQRAGKYKYVSVEMVEQMLNDIRQLEKVTTLTFLDDTFNVPKERFRELLRMMIRNNYKFRWNSFYRSDHGDPETIELMARSGCEGVFLGVESGSDQMLERMNKRSRRKDYLSAIKQFRHVGISTHANTIIGFPGETYDTAQETLSLIEEAKPDFYRAQLWYADPVTPIWEKREEYGIEGSGFNWTHDTMDHQTACELVEQCFLAVENSVWLPQNGFEQWSTFYLQRKGMRLEQIKLFLRCFNATIKQKLKQPAHQEIAPDLLESLRQSCKFDEAMAVDQRPIEVWSGDNYQKAERYWVDQLCNIDGCGGLESIREVVKGPASRGRVRRLVAPDIAEGLKRGCGVDLGVVILAAYGVLLSRLSGREEVIVLSGWAGEPEAMVLRLTNSWEQAFDKHTAQVSRQLSQARAHSRWGLYLLTNQYRLAEHAALCPTLDVGFWHGPQEGSLDELLIGYPELSGSVGLNLAASTGAGQLELLFNYLRSWFQAETVDHLAEYLVSILQTVSENPGVIIGDIMLGQETRARNTVAEFDTAETFNF